MMRLLLFLIFTPFIFYCTIKKDPAQQAEEIDRYIVYTLGDNSLKDIDETKKRLGAKVVKDLKYINGFVAHLTKADRESLTTIDTVIIEKDILHHITSSCSRKPSRPTPTPIEPCENPNGCQEVPWGISAIRADRAHSISKGAGVLICDIDTGIDFTHPDLAANIYGHISMLNDDGYDGNGHGTHTAGTMVALDNLYGVLGVAPEAQLLSVKVLNDNGSGWSSDIADGIAACRQKGAQANNLSLGSDSESTIITNQLKISEQAGIVSFCAAGNDGRNEVGWPAKSPYCKAISSINNDLTLSWFSNYGDEIAFAAPGGDVLSTVPGGYDVYSGTSMAAPHATATYALALSRGYFSVLAADINLDKQEQGAGLVDALMSVR